MAQRQSNDPAAKELAKAVFDLAARVAKLEAETKALKGKKT
jgi:hypothetical protein